MVLGITAEPMQDAEARKRCLNSELANGRLAMMAILGLWVQETSIKLPFMGFSWHVTSYYELLLSLFMALLSFLRVFEVNLRSFDLPP